MITLRAPLKLVLPVTLVVLLCGWTSESVLGQAPPVSPASKPPPATKTPQSYPPEQVQAGETRFVGQCGFCHGRDAGGSDSGPDLIRSTLVAEDVRGDKIGPVIRQGRPDKGMPGSNLSDADIAAIVAFIHDAKAKAEAEAAAAAVSMSKICRPATPKRGGRISTAQAAARRAIRSRAISRKSAPLRGARAVAAPALSRLRSRRRTRTREADRDGHDD